MQIPNVAYSINRESVESHLRQSCLDTINDMSFGGDPLTEFAVVHLATSEFRPLKKHSIGFQMGDFLVDSEFNDDGYIYLLIAYLPVRYDKDT